MVQQTINVGTTADDHTGDPHRTAFTKCNDNFTELYKTAPQHGRLVRVSDTQLKFGPFGGDQIKINGVLYTIPSAGITAGLTGVFRNGTAGQSLTAGTSYLVTVFNNGGTLTFDFLTSLAHATSATAGNVGVEIKSGDDTRTVVGMILVGNTPNFQDTNTWRGVISWLNRRNRLLYGTVTGGIGTSSVALIELSAAARVYFLIWGEEDWWASIVGGFTAAAPGTGSAQVGYDGTSTMFSAAPNITVGTAGWWGAGSAMSSAGATEGAHFITPVGNSSSGVTMNFYVAVNGMIRG